MVQKGKNEKLQSANVCVWLKRLLKQCNDLRFPSTDIVVSLIVHCFVCIYKTKMATELESLDKQARMCIKWRKLHLAFGERDFEE